MKYSWLFLVLLFPLVAFSNPDFMKVKGYDLEYEIAGSTSLRETMLI